MYSDEQKTTKSQNVEQLRKAIQQINLLNTVVQNQQEHIKMQQEEFSKMSARMNDLESKLNALLQKFDQTDKAVKQIKQIQEQHDRFSGSRFEQEMGEQVLSMSKEINANTNAYADQMHMYQHMQNLPEAYQNTFK